jgi:hypothetical protein
MRPLKSGSIVSDIWSCSVPLSGPGPRSNVAKPAHLCGALAPASACQNFWLRLQLKKNRLLRFSCRDGSGFKTTQFCFRQIKKEVGKPEWMDSDWYVS